MLNQARDVTFGRMVGHAAHRHRLAPFFIARRQRNLEDGRRRYGVFMK
jgi:hypothetical protein